MEAMFLVRFPFRLSAKGAFRTIALAAAGMASLSAYSSLSSDARSSASKAPSSPSDATVSCAGRGLCEVTLSDTQKSAAGAGQWQSLRIASGEAIAVQWVDDDRDGVVDRGLFAAPQAAETVSSAQLSDIVVEPAEQGVQFVLSQRVGARWEDGKLAGGRFVDVETIDLPRWHKPGNRLLRYEGPSWEMRDVGYRLYLDERNGTDIFGKQVSDLALDDHGLDGDDYHALKPWGADILKVGDSLGIGAPGVLIDGKVYRIAAKEGISATITDPGPHFARMIVNSAGWKPSGLTQSISVETLYSIAADSRLTRISPKADRAIAGWVTGLVKHEGTQLLLSDDDREWQYLATFGKQSLFDDNLGMAIFYRKSDAAPRAGDTYSHLIAFAGERNQVEYYMGAWWQADPSGVGSLTQFRKLLEDERAFLAKLNQSNN